MPTLSELKVKASYDGKNLKEGLTQAKQDVKQAAQEMASEATKGEQAVSNAAKQAAAAEEASARKFAQAEKDKMRAVLAGTKTIKQSMNDVRRATQDTLPPIRMLGHGIVQGIGFGAGMAGFSGLVRAITGFSYSIVRSNADVDQFETQFGVLLQSAKKGDQMFQTLRNMAAKTPFMTKDLAKAAQTMLAFGIDARAVIPTIKILGDVSLGNRERFEAMSLAFSQMSAAGRLMGQDLMQMVNAGFNPLHEISIKTGESMASLKNKMEAGAISSRMVFDAFRSATQKGGQFFQGMEKGSRTWDGLMSTLADTVAIVEQKVGGPFFAAAKQGLISVIDWINGPAGQHVQEQLAKMGKQAGEFAKEAGPKLIRMATDGVIKVVDFITSEKGQQTIQNVAEWAKKLMGVYIALKLIKGAIDIGTAVVPLLVNIGKIAAGWLTVEGAANRAAAAEARASGVGVGGGARAGGGLTALGMGGVMVAGLAASTLAMKKFGDDFLSGLSDAKKADADAWAGYSKQLEDGVAKLAEHYKKAGLTLSQARAQMLKDATAGLKGAGPLGKARDDATAAVERYWENQARAGLHDTTSAPVATQAHAGKAYDPAQAFNDSVAAITKAGRKTARDKMAVWQQIEEFAKEYGFTVTSTTGGKHNVGSAHYKGLAADVSTRGKSAAEIEAFTKAAQEQGYKVLDERTRPRGQAVWSGPHLHIQGSASMEMAKALAQAAEDAANKEASAHAKVANIIHDEQAKTRDLRLANKELSDQQEVGIALMKAREAAGRTLTAQETKLLTASVKQRLEAERKTDADKTLAASQKDLAKMQAASAIAAMPNEIERQVAEFAQGLDAKDPLRQEKIDQKRKDLIDAQNRAFDEQIAKMETERKIAAATTELERQRLRIASENPDLSPDQRQKMLRVAMGTYADEQARKGASDAQDQAKAAQDLAAQATTAQELARIDRMRLDDEAQKASLILDQNTALEKQLSINQMNLDVLKAGKDEDAIKRAQAANDARIKAIDAQADIDRIHIKTNAWLADNAKTDAKMKARQEQATSDAEQLASIFTGALDNSQEGFWKGLLDGWRQTIKRMFIEWIQSQLVRSLTPLFEGGDLRAYKQAQNTADGAGAAFAQTSNAAAASTPAAAAATSAASKAQFAVNIAQSVQGEKAGVGAVQGGGAGASQKINPMMLLSGLGLLMNKKGGILDDVLGIASLLAGFGAFGKGGWLHFAGGGDLPYGRPALVGEHGPELVSSGPGGLHVYNGAQTNRMLGSGGNVTVVQNITTPNPDGFKRSGKQIASQAFNSLTRSRRRQGRR